MAGWLEVECNRCKMRAESKPSAGRYPPATEYADLEVGSLAEVQVVQKGAKRSTSANDQAHARARNHPVQVGASRRGAVDYNRAYQAGKNRPAR
jgi:hypothetical protein